MNWRTDLENLTGLSTGSPQKQNPIPIDNIDNIDKNLDSPPLERLFVNSVNIVNRDSLLILGGSTQAETPPPVEYPPPGVPESPKRCCSICGGGRYVLLDNHWQCQQCAGMLDHEVNRRKLTTLSLSAQWKPTAGRKA